MAFQRITSDRNKIPPFLTVNIRSNGQAQLRLSVSAYQAMGEPRALHFEWDPDDALIRLVSADPDAPDAHALPPGMFKGLYVTELFYGLGIAIPETVRIPATPDGPLAVIADLSEYRS